MRIEIECKGRDGDYREVLSEPTKAVVRIDPVADTPNIIHMTVACTYFDGGRCLVSKLKDIFCPYDGYIPHTSDDSQRVLRAIKEAIESKGAR